MAEPPARPHAAAGIRPNRKRDESEKTGLKRGNRWIVPAVRVVRALDPGRSPIERARA